MHNRPRVLFVVINDEYVRNYLNTSSLDELSKRFEVSIAASDSLEQKAVLAKLPQFVGFIPTETKQAERLSFLFQISAWRHRSKSRTFFYRWLRWTGWENVRKDRGALDFLKTFSRWFASTLRNPNGFRVTLLGSSLVHPLAYRFLSSRIRPNWQLGSLLSEGSYSVVVYPSSGYEPLGVEIIRETKRLGIPSVCLIDNWDNLSSKTVFGEKPSMLGVWGEQAKAQAISIHGFSQESIAIIGSPRFEKYLDRKFLQALPRGNETPYILFVGSAMPFDEISALHKIEGILRETDPKGKLRVVYRPHPQQQKRKTPSTFNPNSFELVTLDRQFTEAALKGIGVPGTSTSNRAGNKFQPSLDEYPALLSCAQLVIGPLTTMLLEASLCLTPAIGLAYPDRHHFTTTLRYFSHFDGMEKVPGFRFCFSESDLGKLLEESLQLAPIRESDSDKETSYFVLKSATPYSERLCGVVYRALTQAGKIQSPNDEA